MIVIQIKTMDAEDYEDDYEFGYLDEHDKRLKLREYFDMFCDDFEGQIEDFFGTLDMRIVDTGPEE